jgi:hypothetical protein
LRKSSARKQGTVTLEELSSDHAAVQQRVYNFLCAVMGSDPQKLESSLVAGRRRIRAEKSAHRVRHSTRFSHKSRASCAIGKLRRAHDPWPFGGECILSRRMPEQHHLAVC